MTRPASSFFALLMAGALCGAASANDTLLWRNADGQVHIWLMRDGERVAGLNVGDPVGREWTLHGLADLDGDGRDELVWRNANGQVHAWRVDNQLRPSGFNIYRPVGGDWRLEALGDVNGDGVDDIIWQNDAGQVHYWAMQNNRRTAGENLFLPVLQEGWTLEAAGDFNGDGFDDILWRLDDGRVHIWQVEDGEVTGANFVHEAVSANWTIAGAGDMDGDGVDDIIWRNARGALQYWRMQGFERTAGVNFADAVGAAWTLAGLGSFFDVEDFASGCRSMPLATAIPIVNSALEALDPTITIDHRNHNVGRQSLDPYITGQNRFTMNGVPELGLEPVNITLADVPYFERLRRIHFIQDLNSNSILFLPSDVSDARVRISFETDGNEIKGWFVGDRVGQADGRAADADIRPPRGRPYPYIDVFFDLDYDRTRGPRGLIMRVRDVDAQMRLDVGGPIGYLLDPYETLFLPFILQGIERGMMDGFRTLGPAVSEVGGQQLSRTLDIPQVGSIFLTRFRLGDDRAQLCWDTDL